MFYLCKDCCNKLGIPFLGWAVNERGQKRCTRCGDSSCEKLHIMTDEDDKNFNSGKDKNDDK